MSEAEDIKDVVREINRSQITGPLGQSKVVRFYSKYNGKPLKDFRREKSYLHLKTSLRLLWEEWIVD